MATWAKERTDQCPLGYTKEPRCFRQRSSPVDPAPGHSMAALPVSPSGAGREGAPFLSTPYVNIDRLLPLSLPFLPVPIHKPDQPHLPLHLNNSVFG